MLPRGFTLIETVVVVALTGLVFGALGSLLTFFYRTNAHVFQHAQATLETRRGVSDAVRLIREANYNEDGEYPILTAAANSITFSADIDNDDELEEVAYTLSNGVLERTANPSGGGAGDRELAHSVTNDAGTPVFRYFDITGTELADPIDLGQIASVLVTVQVEIDTNRGPGAFTLSGRATLRNSRL